jgi:methyl-accepting chemotaxis protein
LRIGARLGAGFGLVLALMVIVIAVALVRLTSIGSASDQMIRKDWVKAEAAATINATTRANARRSMELFLAPDRAYAEKTRARIEDNKKTISEALDTLDKLVYTPEGTTLLVKIKEQRVTYVASSSKVQQLLTKDKRDEAARAMITETLPALDALQEDVKGVTTRYAFMPCRA